MSAGPEMRRRTQAAILGLSIAIGTAAALLDCGSDQGNVAIFVGNVSFVSPSQAKVEESPRHWLSWLDRLAPARAIAQSTTVVSHVFVCAGTSSPTPSSCAAVKSDGSFLLSIDVRGTRFANGFVGFIDDANQDGAVVNDGDRVAFLTNPIRPVCNGSVVTLTDVSIDFTSQTATAAQVDKDPDTCPFATPTVTPFPTATPFGTATPTRTPTYAASASLNRPPSNALALLSAVGIVGLLLPVRRRSGRA